MWCAAIFLVFVAAIGKAIYNFWTKEYPRPLVDVDAYWGPGNREDAVIDENIHSFKIEYPKEKLDELKRKLSEKYVFTPPLEGARHEHEYGMDSNKLQEYIRYWRDEYLPKWDERLKLFNSLPHYKTNIQGLNIHFIHVKPINPQGKTVVPVMLLHGWPGSVREFYKLTQLLSRPNEQLDVVFEVIVPSLPGYGWSDGSTKTGFTPIQMSIVLRNLMSRLGHGKFYMQCGDWGSTLGSHIATLFPDNVLGYHTNMAFFFTGKSMLKLFIASWMPSMFVDREFQSFHFPVKQWLMIILQQTGYFHIQATKPDTIGCALASHPVGLAAYILEKFNSSADAIGMDRILDNLMVYCMNDVFTTAGRLYAEMWSKEDLQLNISNVTTKVPTAVARFRRDLFFMFDWQLTDKYTNLVQSNYYKQGGHFSAFEVPQTLYGDFVQFVGKVRAGK